MAGIAFGQTRIGKLNRDPYFVAAVNCPAATTLDDGSILICKAGGVAWFVAPNSTEISGTWANGQYNSTSVGTKCCVSEWGTLSSVLSANVCNYVATEWFVPTETQIANPGVTCRTNWNYSASSYWSSTEATALCARGRNVNSGGAASTLPKTCEFAVRAFKCVTY